MSVGVTVWYLEPRRGPGCARLVRSALPACVAPWALWQLLKVQAAGWQAFLQLSGLGETMSGRLGAWVAGSAGPPPEGTGAAAGLLVALASTAACAATCAKTVRALRPPPRARSTEPRGPLGRRWMEVAACWAIAAPILLVTCRGAGLVAAAEALGGGAVRPAALLTIDPMAAGRLFAPWAAVGALVLSSAALAFLGCLLARLATRVSTIGRHPADPAG